MTEEKYKMVCAWCGKLISGYKDAPLENTTHGICEKCYNKELEKSEKGDKE